MLIYKKGNLLEDDAEALVNAVNTVGVMGAGIARQFKSTFPEMYEVYKRDCERGAVQLGKVHVVLVETKKGSKYVINFPTLAHWQDKSKLENIASGLDDLIRVIKEKGIKSIAIPPLGCGVGGLNWDDVRQLIEEKFRMVKHVTVHLYEPL